MTTFRTQRDDDELFQFLGMLSVAEQVGASVDLTKRRYVAGAMDMDPSMTWMPTWGPINNELRADSPLMRARARELVENDGLAMAALNAWSRMVVGNGIPTFADVLDDNNEPIEDLNDALDDFFELAMEEMDLDPDVHHYEQQRLCVGEMVEVGDFLMVQHDLPTSRNRMTPLRLQQLEIEHLDASRDRTRNESGSYIEHGIERGVYHQPLGYWISADQQQSLGWPVSERWNSDVIMHGFWKRKPSQRIGVTWYAPVVKQLVNLSSYMTSEIRSAGYASKFALAVMRENGYGQGLDDGSGDGFEAANDGETYSRLKKMFGPVVADLKVGEDLKVIEHNRPGSEQAVHWLKFFMTVMSSGMGLSSQALTREPTGTFSGNKATRICDQEGLSPVYDHFVRRMVLEARSRVIGRAFEDGKFAKWVQPREFLRNRRKFLRALVPQPRLTWLDPNKEVDAILSAIAGGILDYSVPWGVQGTTWRKGFRLLKQQREYAKSIGLELPEINPVAAGPSIAASAKSSRPDRAAMRAYEPEIRGMVEDVLAEQAA